MSDNDIDKKWHLELAQYTMKDKEVWIQVKEFNVQICDMDEGVTVDIWHESQKEPVKSVLVVDPGYDQGDEEAWNAR